jgi:hypothetical protein
VADIQPTSFRAISYVLDAVQRDDLKDLREHAFELLGIVPDAEMSEWLRKVLRATGTAAIGWSVILHSAGKTVILSDMRDYVDGEPDGHWPETPQQGMAWLLYMAKLNEECGIEGPILHEYHWVKADHQIECVRALRRLGFAPDPSGLPRNLIQFYKGELV